MTMNEGLERVLVDWLSDAATPREVDLDDVFAQTRSMRQRPAWSSPGRWLPMQLTMPRVAIPRAVPVLAAIALLIVALVAATLLIGSRQPPLPPPFGLAATGHFVYDSNGDLYLATTDGESVRPLTSETGEEFGATFSRDGTRIAYWSKPAAGPPQLRVVNADGSGARTVGGSIQLMVDTTFPAVDWSPDGRHVAFSSSSGELYVLDVDRDAAPSRIGDGPLRRFEPAWSPDGTLIAFRGDGGTDIRGVYVVGSDGMGETRISSIPGNAVYPDRRPVWSRDGRIAYHIAVAGGTDNDIFVAERLTAGWVESELTLTPMADEPTLDSWPVWSNDGSQISFVRSPTDNNGFLMVANADGSDVRRIGPFIAGFSPVCWTPDDRSIVAVNAELDVMIGDEAEPGYRIVSLDHSINPILISSPGRQSFGACSWQRLAPEGP
jgi:Tol biopolymer transport system component